MGPEMREKALGAGVLAVLSAWVIVCAWFPLTDTDIWWHLASAKLMWAQKAFLRADPFCLASLGAPWTDLHWGFQLLAYGFWKWGGARALVAWKSLALLGAVLLVLRPHLDRRNLFWMAALAAFGTYHIRLFVDVRPLAMTLLGLGLQYATVLAYLQGRLSKPWLILVPVQVVLVNMQGLYPLGAVLVSCFALGEYLARVMPSCFPGLAFLASAHVFPAGDAAGTSRPAPSWRPLAWTSLALWLAGFINPYGWEGFKLPLALLGRISPVAGNVFSLEIAENIPLPAMMRADPRAGIPFVLMAAVVIFTFDRARRRTSAGHALLFAAFGLLGLMAQRNLPLAYLACLMAAGRNLQASPGPIGPRARRAWAAGGIAALSAVILLYAPRIKEAWEYELPGSLETPFRFPSGAAGFLETHPLPGHIFNELRYGGYLEYRLYPPKLTFVDGRMIVRDDAFYREFLDVVDHPPRFDVYRARYGITHVLLPIAEDRRYVPLLGYLLRQGEWRLLHCDGASALLARGAEAEALALPLDSLAPDHPVRTALRRRFAANPRLERLAEGNLSRFLEEAGLGRAARDVFR